MQAMAEEFQRVASMHQAASERYADADMRERDLVRREEVETLKRKWQVLSRSFS